jgi:hypothetical protein
MIAAIAGEWVFACLAQKAHAPDESLCSIVWGWWVYIWRKSDSLSSFILSLHIITFPFAWFALGQFRSRTHLSIAIIMSQAPGRRRRRSDPTAAARLHVQVRSRVEVRSVSHVGSHLLGVRARSSSSQCVSQLRPTKCSRPGRRWPAPDLNFHRPAGQVCNVSRSSEVLGRAGSFTARFQCMQCVLQAATPGRPALDLLDFSRPVSGHAVQCVSQLRSVALDSEVCNVSRRRSPQRPKDCEGRAGDDRRRRT